MVTQQAGQMQTAASPAQASRPRSRKRKCGRPRNQASQNTGTQETSSIIDIPSIPHSSSIIHHPSSIIQHPASSIQHSAFSIQHPALILSPA
jgi:hypothetical protein